MTDHDTNAEETVSRRSVLKTAGGLIAGSTALAGVGAEGGAALPNFDDFLVEVQEMNEEYIAVEVRMSEELYERVNERGAFPERVFLGDADQFVVHDDEDAVSLPEEPERLATPVETEAVAGHEGHWILYFRTGDVDWPKEYDGVDVTLALGAFPERTVPGDHWDTTPGLWIDVREMTEDYIVVKARLPDGMETDEVDFTEEVFLGLAEQFVIHEEEDAVSLPEDTEELATPVEMDFDNPHEVVLYFRTQDSKVADFIGQDYLEVGLGLFPERTIPGTEWDTCPGHRDY